MGVDDDRVALGDRGVRLGRDERVVAARQQREEAAVGGVDVQAHAVALAQRQRLVDAVDGAEAGRAGGEHDVPTSPLAHSASTASRSIRPQRVGRHGRALHAEQLAHARVGVVRGGAVDDRLPGWSSRATHSASRLAIVPLEVRWPRPGGGEPEHGAQLLDHLDLQPAGPGAAVERVVVGVDEHRREVAGDRHRVRRLEHLAGVARVEEGVVVGHPLAERVPGGGQPLRVGLARGVRVVGPEALLPGGDERGGARDELGELVGAGGRRHGRAQCSHVGGLRRRSQRCVANCSPRGTSPPPAPPLAAIRGPTVLTSAARAVKSARWT